MEPQVRLSPLVPGPQGHHRQFSSDDLLARPAATRDCGLITPSPNLTHGWDAPDMEDRRNSRLEARPGEQIDRAEVVEFEFDGHPVRGFKGDTIASALFAGGQRVFSRSFKYHRPRGLLCCSGNCPNCLVTVGDEPNVRSCTRPIEPGLQVQSQNAWPSLHFDILSVLDRMHWLMPVGLLLQSPAPAQGPVAAGQATHTARRGTGQHRYQWRPR